MQMQGQIPSVFKIVILYSSWGFCGVCVFYNITLTYYMLLSEFHGAP